MQPAKGEAPARTYVVRVAYGLHCFTRGFQLAEDLNDPRCYGDSREVRIFDARRYALSRDLPGLIEGLPYAKCFHAQYENFFVVKKVNTATGLEEDYEVYFNASRNQQRDEALSLFVQSAFVRDRAHQSRPKRKPIGFFVILHNRLTNRRIVAPP